MVAGPNLDPLDVEGAAGGGSESTCFRKGEVTAHMREHSVGANPRCQLDPNTVRQVGDLCDRTEERTGGPCRRGKLFALRVLEFLQTRGGGFVLPRVLTELLRPRQMLIPRVVHIEVVVVPLRVSSAVERQFGGGSGVFAARSSRSEAADSFCACCRCASALVSLGRTAWLLCPQPSTSPHNETAAAFVDRVMRSSWPNPSSNSRAVP